jgi:hypothetical protein
MIPRKDYESFIPAMKYPKMKEVPLLAPLLIFSLSTKIRQFGCRARRVRQGVVNLRQPRSNTALRQNPRFSQG